MTWTIYDPTTGIMTSRVHNKNQIIGRSHVAGSYQPGRYYFKQGKVRPLPDTPASQEHVVWLWDLATETWSVDTTRTEWAAKRRRQDLFAAVDKVSPMWWASMTPEQQEATQAYRQAIIDLPEQLNWPVVIAYPLKPAWL